MAISAATLRGRLRSTANQSTAYSSSSTAMGADALAIAFVAFANDSAVTVDSISGYGITWVDLSSAFASTSFQFKSGTNGQQCFIYVGLTGAGTASGSLSVDPSGSCTGCNITVIELTGDFSGTSDPLDAILQVGRDPSGAEESATSQTPSLGSAPDSDSRCIAYWGMNTNSNVTFDGDWTSLDNGGVNNPTHSMGVAWRSDAADQTTSGSWSPNIVRSVGYIIEIAEVPTAASAVTMSVGNVNIGF